MTLLRNDGATRALSRPAGSAPAARLDAPASWISRVFDWLLGATECDRPVADTPGMSAVLLSSPRWIASAYRDDPDPDQVTEDVETWPAWTFLPIQGALLADGSLRLNPDAGLDPDRFTDCCCRLKRRPTITVDRDAEGGDA